MSDTSNRSIGAPPPIRRGGGAASLIRENRPAQAEDALEEPVDLAPGRSITGPPPVPRISAQQTIASAPAPDPQQAENAVLARPVPEQTAPPANFNSAIPTVDTPLAPTSTPYTRRRGATPSGENPNDIIKVTFEIRRGDRDAFNAAFPMAQLREGYESPKDLLQTIYNAETRRLEETYNDGQPFPLRKRQLPRGRPIQSAS
jgi:hypothetical protein